MICEYRRRYIGSDEEFHYATCKDDAEFAWYEVGQIIHMCRLHTREFWFFAQAGPLAFTQPLSRIKGVT